MNEKQFLEFLHNIILTEGSERAAALRLKVSPQYLNDVVRRRRTPGKKLLRSMKLQKVVLYESAAAAR